MIYKNFLFAFGLLVFLTGCVEADSKMETLASGEIPDVVDFNFHIRPILSDRCYACHGPDANARKADLRLDLEEGAYAMLDSVDKKYSIVPGEPKKSLVIDRIWSKDPGKIMPPPESNLKLSEYEKKLLEKWVEQGAKWKKHWAFIPPQKPKVPEVKNAAQVKNPIDNFVLAKLDQEGLQPSPEAKKEKLIRRLSFDVRGIPPSLEEIDRFLADEDAKAYEKLVDSFLDSKDYAERMALEWLDLARYSDSHGYQDDLERSMWPWRDWVIEAFDENMPYDQFVSWQLAGDLMPDATYKQKLATGFNRNHKITQEVGVVKEEYRVEYVLDRVNTVSTSFMGLTVACAQCHDHKYDPISQKEFYSFFSFFNNVPESGRVEYSASVAEPSLPLPEEKVAQLKAYVDDLIVDQKEKITEYEKTVPKEALAMADLKGDFETSTKLPSGLVAHYPFDYIENGQVKEEIKGTICKTFNEPITMPGNFSGALEFNGENYVEVGTVKAIDFRRPVSLGFWVYSISDGALGAILAPKLEMENGTPGYEVYINDQKTIKLTVRGSGGELVVMTQDRLPKDKWTHIALTYDGSRKAKGVKIYFDGKPTEQVTAKDALSGTASPAASNYVGRRTYRGKGAYGNFGMWRVRLDELMVFDRVLDETEVKEVVGYHPLKKLADKETRNDHENKRLFYHQLFHKDPMYQSLAQRHSEYKLKEERMNSVILKPTMIMADMDTVRPTYVLDRGSYSAPTDRVYPDTPEQVLSFSEELPKNRLGLAKWFFDAKNPLTARVAVNRYWQMIFGQGIVATPEDFGMQGHLPTHPELLDWLALDFSASKWDVKRLIKTMVMSATYRQSTVITPEQLERDKNNVLLARGPQVRIAAELIRDNALAVSGLLSHKIGGPSVKPYQPDGLWMQVASGNQPLKKYIQEHDENLYRKSMYTFWKRTLPPPSMLTFDASTREQCSVKRQSTSTPMQALVLLNDPQFLEASRLVAERMLKEGGSDVESRIEFAFRLATSRYPNATEKDLLLSLMEDQQKRFGEHPDRASEFLTVGEYPMNFEGELSELASYTVVANAILNLTEAIRKG